jgi:hypothetical protein
VDSARVFQSRIKWLRFIEVQQLLDGLCCSGHGSTYFDDPIYGLDSPSKLRRSVIESPIGINLLNQLADYKSQRNTVVVDFIPVRFQILKLFWG